MTKTMKLITKHTHTVEVVVVVVVVVVVRALIGVEYG